MYCTYITFYQGNQLPPFYIGYTSVNNINSGYNGSVSSKKYKKVWAQERAALPHLFRTVILRTFNTREEALEHEERLLRSLNVHKNDLYINMHISGKRFTISGPFSEEHRRKMSEAAKKKGQDPEVSRKKSEAAKKRWQDPEQRRKASEANKKRYQDPEQRRKAGELSKKRYQDPEERRRHSEAAKKRLQDPEQRRKYSEGAKKRSQNPEYRRKLSEVNKKKWQDPEFRQKMSAGIKKATQAMTPEQRSLRSKKAYETRRLNVHAALNHSVTDTVQNLQ